MSAFVQRLILTAVAIGWLAPSVSALGLGIHLASTHLGPHALEHQAELEERLKAATHGHHHDLESDSDHNHEVRFERQAPTFRPDYGAATVPSQLSASNTELGQGATLYRAFRRGPPRPSFEVYCVLLI